MKTKVNLTRVKDYFTDKLEKFGATPKGMDWNSTTAQEMRFEQTSRIIEASGPYSILDYGCGYGALLDFLIKKGHQPEYYGFDILEVMVSQGRNLHANQPDCTFTSNENELPVVDYAVANGVFNLKLEATNQDWTEYILTNLNKMHNLSRNGMAFTFLTKYSDREYMRQDLYYADPCFYFDYCKRNFSRNVALLHDYGLYDFTILVRKQV